MIARVPLLAAFVWTPAALATPPPSSPPFLPRSSIAAVLGHRGELGLTDAQVARLEALDDALASERSELGRAAAAPPAGEGSPAGDRGASDGARPEAGAAGGGPSRMGGPGGPGMAGGRSGDGMRGPGGGGGDRRRADRGPSDEAVRTQLDDADTRAYLRAEEALAPEQRDRAREIASEYRAALYDAREAHRK